MATSVSSAVVERSHTGRERQRRERGGDDEWPRFDVDAKQARFGVWLLRAGSRCGGRAFRVLVALAGVVSLLVGVRDRFACIVMCGLVAALDADTDHERRSRDDEEPGEQRAGPSASPAIAAATVHGEPDEGRQDDRARDAEPTIDNAAGDGADDRRADRAAQDHQQAAADQREVRAPAGFGTRTHSGGLGLVAERVHEFVQHGLRASGRDDPQHNRVALVAHVHREEGAAGGLDGGEGRHSLADARAGSEAHRRAGVAELDVD
jgi:hypothetical protein